MDRAGKVSLAAGPPRAMAAAQGQVAEWFKAAVLKTAVGASSTWVRIPPCPPSGEVQPPVFSAKIEQRVAVRLELRTHHAADEDEMVARLVERFVLALEGDE
jgi:hypothetical protein